MRRAAHVARMWQGRGVYRILVGKPGGNRPRHRWEDNIKIDKWDVGVWIVLSWFRIWTGGRHL